MEELGSPNSNSTECLSTELLGRLEQLYPQIAPIPENPLDTALPEFGAPTLEVPPIDELTSRVVQSSFKIFDAEATYHGSTRAKEFVSWSSPRSKLYRIYFNAYSRKVYVDLNGERWSELESSLQKEILYCEILRTLIFVLTCEVELSEAREAEKAAGEAGDTAVTSEVTEVIIP